MRKFKFLEFKAALVQMERYLFADNNAPLHSDPRRACTASEYHAPRKLDGLAEIAVLLHRTGRQPDALAVVRRLEPASNEPCFKIT